MSADQFQNIIDQAQNIYVLLLLAFVFFQARSHRKFVKAVTKLSELIRKDIDDLQEQNEGHHKQFSLHHECLTELNVHGAEVEHRLRRIENQIEEHTVELEQQANRIEKVEDHDQ